VAQLFKQRIVKNYCVRFHMSLIVMAVVASGVLSSKCLLLAGVHSLRLRYPIAVLCAYGVFLGMVRLWIWYVAIRQVAVAAGGGGNRGTVLDGVDVAVPDVSLPDVSSGAPSVSFGGGDAGGAGASDAWGMAAHDVQASSRSSASTTSGSGSSWFPDLDLDFGDDGWWILLILALLAIVIFCAGGYLVYAAPDILGEAAWQAVLGSVLVRARQHAKAGWMTGVVRSTAIPFTVVLLVAGVLGWQAHRYCPKAARLAQVFHCAVQ
jgi:hypothetical protein